MCHVYVEIKRVLKQIKVTAMPLKLHMCTQVNDYELCENCIEMIICERYDSESCNTLDITKMKEKFQV